MTHVIARDGLPARDSGRWGLTKLSFLDRYRPAAIQATRRKLQRYYVDLFAGPGVNVIRGAAGQEYEGSPLRVLQYAGQQDDSLTFTHAVFINARRLDHDTLSERIDRLVASGRCRIPRENIDLIFEDANRAAEPVMRRIPLQAYVLVFADMEAPKQWPWVSMRALKALGHQSIDLYTLFPIDMAIMRLLAYQAPHADRYGTELTRFFGTDRWSALRERRITDAQSPRLRRALVHLYLDQLRSLWERADEMIDVYYRGEQRLYKMLFASDHPVADVIAGWVKQHAAAAQQEELFG